jgi:lipopolysaccharide transport system permease protein
LLTPLVHYSSCMATEPAASPASSSDSPVAATDHRRGVIADLLEIGRDVWTYRELLAQLTRRDIRIRYKQAVMGFGWAVLMPAVIIMAGIGVRIAMGTVSGQGVERAELAGIAVKAIPWAFFVGAVGFATPSLTSNVPLLTKIYFPREVFPLAATLTQAFDTMIGALALIIALPFLGVRLTEGLVWVPLLLAVLFVFTVAIALFLSCANLFFRDVKYIVQIFITFGIFATPVFVEPVMFGARGAKWLMLNPLAPLLEGLRLAIVESHNLAMTLTVSTAAGPVTVWDPLYLVYSGAWAVGGLLIASLLFHRMEFLFAEFV